MSAPGPTAHLFVLLQRLLPRYWITKLVYSLTRIRTPGIKNFLIRRFVAAFSVDTSEARLTVPDEYPTFNDFFIRELRDGLRPIDTTEQSLCSPVDGTLSACGTIESDRLFQAKGKSYSLQGLLAVDVDDAKAYRDGRFATIYLAPYNYHRVHAPFAGTLKAMHYVPGDLFSVNAATVQLLPGLFARNERLVCHYDTPEGPSALVFVGALNVGSISTPWTGEIRPRKDGVVETLSLDEATPTNIAKGDLLGWFNMGSTVIVLLPDGAGEWDDSLQPGDTVIVGQRIGQRIGQRGRTG